MFEDGPRVIPPGGWSYPEHPGSEPIRASGPNELVDAITKDRIANQKPLGDPVQDIRNYVISNYPSHAGSVSVRDTATTTPAKNQRERITQWLANRYSLRAGGNTELESDATAEKRAQSCKACPYNENFQIDCPPCQVQNDRVAFLLRQGKTTPTKVMSCSLCGHDNSVAIFLPEKMLAHRKNYELPAGCWMKNLEEKKG